MELVKLIPSLSGYSYSQKEASNDEMYILADFLTDDVGCHITTLKRWAVDDSIGMAASGNATCFEKKGNYVFFTHQHLEEEIPTVLKMTRQQLIQILDEWYEYACNLEFKEITIKRENDQFTFEANNE